MLRFIWLLRKRGRRTAVNTVKKVDERLQDSMVEEMMPEKIPPTDLWNKDFALHMERFIGQTVTIFVKSGGPAGAGFTGILFRVNGTYASLISRMGPAPAYPFGNTFINATGIWSIKHMSLQYYSGIGPVRVRMLGSITHIPIEKIASFVHNAL